MKNVLFVDCCIRREASNTKKLAEAFLSALPSDCAVTRLDLMAEDLSYFKDSYFDQREALLAENRRDHPRFRYAHQFAQADLIVIAAPFWDLSFPALLKVYIEQVSVDGITFGSTEEGLKGLCRASHMIFLTTRGGFYTGDAMEMGSRYLEALHTFFGIGEYACIAADGMNVAGFDAEASLRRAMQDAEDAARQAALSVDVYEQSCQNRARQLLRALQSYAPDTDNLPAAFTALDRMQRSLKELDAAREAAKAAAAQRELLAEPLPLQAEPLADPIPEPEQSPEEIARQLPTLQASRRELQSQLDRLLGQIRAIGSPDELRTRLQEDETRLTALQQEYDAIALAMQALSAANTTLQNRFSPALGARAAEIFAALSGGRYDKVLLSRDFALSAEPSGDAAARSIQLLSQGTADQLYLAVRLAICEMVLPADRKSPLILDDALANFDDDRLAAALDWLLVESTSRQILLFTCQNRESAYLAGREGVHFLTLETPI